MQVQRKASPKKVSDPFSKTSPRNNQLSNKPNNKQKSNKNIDTSKRNNLTQPGTTTVNLPVSTN